MFVMHYLAQTKTKKSSVKTYQKKVDTFIISLQKYNGYGIYRQQFDLRIIMLELKNYKIKRKFSFKSLIKISYINKK